MKIITVDINKEYLDGYKALRDKGFTKIESDYSGDFFKRGKYIYKAKLMNHDNTYIYSIDLYRGDTDTAIVDYIRDKAIKEFTNAYENTTTTLDDLNWAFKKLHAYHDDYDMCNWNEDYLKDGFGIMTAAFENPVELIVEYEILEKDHEDILQSTIKITDIYVN